MGSSTNIESNMKLTAGLLSLLQISGSFATLSDWVKWKQEHGMEFAGNEDRVRYQHFLRTKAFVLEHNARFMRGEETYHVSLNKFAAMPNEEFVQKYMGKTYELSEKQLVTEYQCDHKYNRAAGGAPSSHSWKNSRVTSVKDQGSCGSCWTFGAGAAIEGAMCAAGLYNCGSWNGVSTQQLVDCASYNSNLNPYDTDATVASKLTPCDTSGRTAESIPGTTTDTSRAAAEKSTTVRTTRETALERSLLAVCSGTAVTRTCSLT